MAAIPFPRDPRRCGLPGPDDKDSARRQDSEALMRAPARARAPGRACSVCIAGGALAVTARADVIVIVIRDVTVTRIVTPTIIAMCSAKPLASVPPPAAITLAPAPAPHQQLRSSPHGALHAFRPAFSLFCAPPARMFG